MSLAILPIRDAIRRGGRNSQNTYPARPGDAPSKTLDLHVEPSFRMRRQDSIFTVGSCFARQIEAALHEFGFALPALKGPAEALGLVGKDTGALNKYTPSSIANEIRWAFNDLPHAPIEQALISSQEKFWDGQLHVRMLELVDYDVALKRRLAVNAAYKALATSDVAIITFGLVETWRDRETGLFLNEAPPRLLMRNERFELVLFSFDDCLEEGRYILSTIYAVNPSIHIMVTVSPVALGVTFSSDPAVVRNCYSKSVLRAAVEQLRYEFPRMDYYPSYERVTYSDRRTAFDQDEAHVSPGMTNHTIVSMLQQYLDTDVMQFTEGPTRLWWKALFEGDRETALTLFRAYPKRILKRLNRFPALKAEFDVLIGEDSFNLSGASGD
jgi:hypothetical protein